MEILILGDSTAFGRPKYGICRDKTWPYLLSKELGCGLQMRARAGSTMIDIAKEAQFLNTYWFEGLKTRLFDITFIQAGIVDCCPRIVPRRIYPYARRAPGFRNLERSPRAHHLLSRPWTNELRFSQAVSGLLKILPNISKASYFVEIAKPANFLIQNVGDFADVVCAYNSIIIKEACSASLVSWQAEKSGATHLLPDGHHLTALGHQAVANACLDRCQGVM